MTITKLTNSGEVAIPPEIIEWLKLKPGDSIDFAIASDGKVYLQAAKIDVRELSSRTSIMLTVLSFVKMLNQPAGNDCVAFTKVNIVSFTFVRLLIWDAV